MNASPKAGVSQAALWTLSFSLLPIMLVYANYPTALPVLKAEWSLANADAGFIYFAFYAGYVVASAVLTGATDYFSARTIYLFSAAWLGLTNLMFPFLAEGLWTAALLRCACGVGLAGVFGPGLRIVAERAPPERRAKMVSGFAFFFTFSVAASMFLTGWLLPDFGWRFTFAAGSLGPVVGVLMVLIWVPDPGKEEPGEKEKFAFPRLPLRCWVLIGSYVMHRWEVFAFRGWGVTFLASAFLARGMSRTSAVDNAATALALMIAISAFSNFLGAWCADRFGRLPSIGGSLFLSGTMAFGMGFLFDAPAPLLLAAALLWAVTMAADASVFLVVMSEVSPRRHLGTALGCLAGFGFLFGALSSVEVGYILDVANPGSRGEALPREWRAAWASVGAAVWLGVGGILWLSRITRRRARDA